MDAGGGAVAAPAALTTIRTTPETGSTNADMAALARTGLGEGVWLRAERQTAGRGRQGRGWVSPPGNLYASTLVRLRPTDPAPATLGMVAAVALEDRCERRSGAVPPLARRSMTRWVRATNRGSRSLSSASRGVARNRLL